MDRDFLAGAEPALEHIGIKNERERQLRVEDGFTDIFKAKTVSLKVIPGLFIRGRGYYL